MYTLILAKILTDTNNQAVRRDTIMRNLLTKDVISDLEKVEYLTELEVENIKSAIKNFENTVNDAEKIIKNSDFSDKKKVFVEQMLVEFTSQLVDRFIENDEIEYYYSEDHSEYIKQLNGYSAKKLVTESAEEFDNLSDTKKSDIDNFPTVAEELVSLGALF